MDCQHVDARSVGVHSVTVLVVRKLKSLGCNTPGATRPVYASTPVVPAGHGTVVLATVPHVALQLPRHKAAMKLSRRAQISIPVSYTLR
jgi:hypothetical protein